MRTLSQKLGLLLFVSLLYVSRATQELSEESPIIGIVSAPSDFKKYYDPELYSYTMITYPRFVEVSGARSILIPYDQPEEEVFHLLRSVNGVIFIGGDADYFEIDPKTGRKYFTPFMEKMQKIFNFIKEENENGNYLPLLAICQGLEVVLMAWTDDAGLLDTYVDSQTHGPVQLIQTGSYSRMFRGVSEKLDNFMLENGTLFYNHEYGYNLSSLDHYPLIEESLRLTAIADDQNGKIFISAMEAKDWPLYMTQYHPERVLRESEDESFYQAKENVDFVLQLSEFFVEETKKNTNRFESESEWENLDLSIWEPEVVKTSSGNVFKIIVANKDGEIINKRTSRSF